MTRLEIRHLEVLLAVQRLPSLTQAAQRLGVTQSALSHRIREAERRLGIQLCERHNRALRLTPAGERIAAGAKAILRDLEELERQAQLSPSGISHILKIGSRAYSCYRWLPEFLKHFRTVEPGLAVEFVDDAATRPFEALEEDLVDVSIQSGTATARGIERVHLFRDELVAILPPQHPKAAQR
ncbi:MAG TPA: LysR family transcriptional regulator, partial [Stellaceae bacterium]|nr:LysR family transcriptional regulator [Stellaceae bacterium]